MLSALSRRCETSMRSQRGGSHTGDHRSYGLGDAASGCCWYFASAQGAGLEALEICSLRSDEVLMPCALPKRQSSCGVNMLNVIDMGRRLAAFSNFEVSLKLEGCLELQLLKRNLAIAPMIEDGEAVCLGLLDCARCD